MAERDQREPRHGNTESPSRVPTGGPRRQLLLGGGAAALLAVGGLAGYAFALADSGVRIAVRPWTTVADFEDASGALAGILDRK